MILEAESFENVGGWSVETQSVRQMGSAYLMAHGMGVPVADAETTADIASPGMYTVWARTRNWIEEWASGKYPGRFEILVNGVRPEPPAGGDGILGTNGKDWNWQLAGSVKLGKGPVKISLHDLTGFNGRCDKVALVLSEQGNITPPSESSEQQVFDAGKTYDLIVVGGGVAGTCTAIAAARCGVKTLCLQDRDMLGGCNSSEVRVGMGGMIGQGKYPALGRVVGEIQPLISNNNPLDAKYYEDDRKTIAFDTITKYYGSRGNVPGVAPELMLRQYVYAVEMKPGTDIIDAVISMDMRTGRRTRYRAKWFCDASGDAVVSRLSGCETMYGCEPRSRFNEACAPIQAKKQVMGMSIQWLSEDRGEDSPFPDISDWALKMDETTGVYNLFGTWDQESGFFRNMADDTEAIRDYGLLSVFSNWHWMKNVSPRKNEFARYAFKWISSIGGKRESYRVVGDYVFNQNDLHRQVMHPDGTAAATWNIDFHFPDPRIDGKFKEPIRSAAYHRGFGGEPIPVPYRCLYARDCGNLFLAGRHISVSHAAFACVRVMRTLGALGEAVGLAASICLKYDCLPRDVYGKYLDEYCLLLKNGVPSLPQFHTGGFKIGEAYHMNSRGWFPIYPAEKGTLPNDAIKDIKAMGYTHMSEHPDLQDRRRRLILADESRGYLHYYDSFSPKSCFSIAVEKPVRDLKKINDDQYRAVCNSGFQTISLSERTIVEEFKPSVFNDYQPVACCDLPDGEFVFCVNSVMPQVSQGICFCLFSKARELKGIVRLEEFGTASSMREGRNGEWLLTHSGGFARVRIDPAGMKADVIADYPCGGIKRIYEVVPDPLSSGYVAGCGYDGIVRFDESGRQISVWNVPVDTGRESCFYAQVQPRNDGHVYLAHWTGYGENDSFRGWQAVEFDRNGEVVWFLDSPDRFGSISGISVIDA